MLQISKCKVHKLLKAFVLLFSHSFDELSGTMDVGYPRSIEDDFPGIGDEIDAAAYHYGTAASTTAVIGFW